MPLTRDALIRELARDLRPVRPIPPLRWVAVGVVIVWGCATAAASLLFGVEAPRTEGRLVGSLWVFMAGSARPGWPGWWPRWPRRSRGRERLSRRSAATAALMLAVAAGVAAALLRDSPLVAPPAPATAAFRCLAVACLAAAVPAAALVAFGARAAAFRPLVLVLAAAAGTAALGGISAKTSCPYGDLAHLLTGHVLAPVAGALFLTLPLLVALRRLQLRSDRS